jgi:hypothetical protein
MTERGRELGHGMLVTFPCEDSGLSLIHECAERLGSEGATIRRLRRLNDLIEASLGLTSGVWTSSCCEPTSRFCPQPLRYVGLACVPQGRLNSADKGENVISSAGTRSNSKTGVQAINRRLASSCASGTCGEKAGGKLEMSKTPEASLTRLFLAWPDQKSTGYLFAVKSFIERQQIFIRHANVRQRRSNKRSPIFTKIRAIVLRTSRETNVLRRAFYRFSFGPNGRDQGRQPVQILTNAKHQIGTPKPKTEH